MSTHLEASSDLDLFLSDQTPELAISRDCYCWSFKCTVGQCGRCWWIKNNSAITHIFFFMSHQIMYICKFLREINSCKIAEIMFHRIELVHVLNNNDIKTIICRKCPSPIQYINPLFLLTAIIDVSPFAILCPSPLATQFTLFYFTDYSLAESTHARLLSRSKLISVTARGHVGGCYWMSWIHMGESMCDCRTVKIRHFIYNKLYKIIAVSVPKMRLFLIVDFYINLVWLHFKKWYMDGFKVYSCWQAGQCINSCQPTTWI